MLRNLWHWFNRAQARDYRGPKKGRVVLQDGSLLDFTCGSYEDRAKLSKLAPESIFAVALVVPASNEWSIEATSDGFNTAVRYQCAQTKQAWERAMRVVRRFVRWHAWLERWYDAHPEAALERELRRVDWTSHMSDDFRSWAGGEAHMRQVQALAAKCSPERAEALFAKYRPAA